MLQLPRYTRIATLLLSLTLLQGCFYLVEEGKGGVAERFPVPQPHGRLSQRLQQCEATMSVHNLHGKPQLHPALYQQVEMRLTESRRLFKAEYYPQAEFMLEPVEVILQLMNEGLHLQATQHLCQFNGHQEICL